MSDSKNRLGDRVVDALPDTPDFRDKLYEATLVEVPQRTDLEIYRDRKIPVLDQGREGACTGFGLATVANFLLTTRQVLPDLTTVSPRMFYEMARRYDEWPGEDYSGVEARGAMKGWNKHGVCSAAQWPYRASGKTGGLTRERTENASLRPLGAYYRVNHKDLICMHAAITEVGVLYATAMVHGGWESVGKDGMITRSAKIVGGHAFAIVGYNEEGFWIQNSWGTDWGYKGFCHISYDDWLANGTDVWVARLGVPVRLVTADAVARSNNRLASGQAYAFPDLRPHIISLGNDGALQDNGTYATSEAGLRTIFEQDMPAVMKAWSKKRVLLYAHGGLTGEEGAVQHLADHRSDLLDREIYPLTFIWHSDFWSTLKDILSDALRRRRPEGILGAVKGFMLDRVDDTLEPVARVIGGKAEWDEMKENARLATESKQGGARKALAYLKTFVKENPGVEVHLAGHSAGSGFLAPVVEYLTGSDGGARLGITSCTLWAPACTVEVFKKSYLPAIRRGAIDRFAMFTLTDRAEQDDNCGEVYNKSLLYLVSNAFELKGRIPLIRDGVPILGMEKWVREDAELVALFKTKKAQWVLSPNAEPLGSPDGSASTSHGGFDDDQATLHATLARILGTSARAGGSKGATGMGQERLGVRSVGEKVFDETTALAKQTLKAKKRRR